LKSTSPFVITISRQFGSGGAYIGQQLSKRLDIFYADREIISQAAKQLLVLEEDLESSDEKIISFWQSFLRLCTFCSPDTYVPPQAIAPTYRQLFKIESEIIDRIAKERSVVIIGRCGSHILRNHPNHISIFLHGDIKYRKNRIKELYKVMDGTASNMITKSDSQRAHYHHTFTGKDWTDASQYDISIDTSKTELDKIVDFLVKYIELLEDERV